MLFRMRHILKKLIHCTDSKIIDFCLLRSQIGALCQRLASLQESCETTFQLSLFVPGNGSAEWLSFVSGGAPSTGSTSYRLPSLSGQTEPFCWAICVLCLWEARSNHGLQYVECHLRYVRVAEDWVAAIISPIQLCSQSKSFCCRMKTYLVKIHKKRPALTYYLAHNGQASRRGAFSWKLR